jgi:tetratricopeptide (TPR) repeat protein
MADCFRGLLQHERSLDYWNRILLQDPRNKVILTRAGDACKNIAEYDNVEFDTYAVMGLALIAKAQEKHDEAIISFKRLIQQDNKNYRLYTELSDCYLKTGDKRKAKETLEDFQKLGIKNQSIAEKLETLK